MSADTWLGNMSKMLESSRLEREALRARFNEELPPPILFVPEEPDSQRGVGWFRSRPEGFVAFRKYDNGYEMSACMQLTDVEVRALAEALPK